MWTHPLELAANGGALLLHLALKATVLLLATFAFVRVFHRSSAALRHTLWSVCCLGLLLLPAFTTTLPAWNISVVNSPGSSATSSDSGGTPVLLSKERTTSQLLRSIAAGHSASAPGVSSEQWALAGLFLFWFVGAVVTARKVAQGYAIAQRLQHRGRPVEEGELWQEFVECAESLDLRASALREAPRLLLIDDEALAVPLTWGWRRPLVLMPINALQWPRACRRAAFLHELSHIRRLDWLVQSLATLTCLFYWFHPLAWFASGRLRLESERATDDHVLATGLKATDYSSSLLEIVRFVGSGRGSGTHRKDSLMKFAVPVAGASKIEIRLRSLLDPKQNRSAVTKKLLAAISLFAFATVVPLAAAKEPAEVEPPVEPTIPVRGVTTQAQAKPDAATPARPKRLGYVVTGFKFTGNFSFPSDDLEKVLVSKKGAFLEDKNVREDVTAIQNAYYAKGIYARARQVQQDQTGVISYYLEEFRAITGFEFTGNTVLTSEELQKVLVSKAGASPSQASIAADMRAIRKAYSDRGFSVSTQLPLQDGAGVMTYGVQENRAVTGFKFTGNTLLTGGELQKVLVSKKDMALQPQNIAADLTAIQKAYSDKGYTVLVKNAVQKDDGALSYDLLEAKLTKIELAGLAKTDPQEVRKLIATSVNAPLDAASLRRDVSRLLDTNRFAAVSFLPNDDPVVKGGVVVTFRFKEKGSH